MHPPDPLHADPGRPGPARPARLLRFTRAERSIHHVTALLMGVCLVTAGMLYLPLLSTLVGHRELVKTVHVWCGFALPVPIVLGLVSRAFRTDLRSLNRFAPHDWEWLRRGDRRAVLHGRGVLPVGKFNAGQKLNAAFTAGAILVMLGTGEMLTFPGPWPVHWRTGATFVHDWLFLLIVLVVAGHLWEAFRDRGALGGMLTGRVDSDWAARHHPGWWDAVQRAATGATGGRPGTASGEAVSGTSGNGDPEFAKRRPGTS
ncbi:cytochrome b/b6 domain-containing protein [Actinomadura opuntiae]|uniref:cytochrome b/b6 domain-containing protein n=1 Tax=Actinomadura sp. OS1-43 TaxID=604315 RepID=UPI00255A76B3|nr:cytochrome b/b6 domain-containing protein [Actinomadura sp. OS1-43]MDL4815855.1 cytochrome b/b6 domain-containing protein [Actinomadura sp. OS1-43]